MPNRKHLPDTSHQAKAMASLDMKKDHWAKILRALKELQGGIYTEIADACNLDRHAVGRRLRELEPPSDSNPQGMNKVFKPGLKRNTPSGRPAYVYVLVDNPIKTEVEEVRYRKEQPTAAEIAIKLIKSTLNPTVTQPNLF